MVKLNSERNVKVYRKRGSLVHWPLVPEAMGSISAAGEKNFRCPNMFSLVSFAGMTIDKCAVLRIGKIAFHLKVDRLISPES